MRNSSWPCWRASALLISSLLGPVAGGTAHADDAMRCGEKLISLGNSTYDVQALCGPPDFSDRRVVQRAVRNQVRANCVPSASVRCSSAVIDSVEIVIDEWTYDFGSNRFVQYLTFESGKLIAVRNGAYGHKAPQ